MFNFAQTIKKQPIVCGEVPGFVVNASSCRGCPEVWRYQEGKALSIKAVDEAIAGANVTPAPPFMLVDCSASTPSCTSPSTCTRPTVPSASTCTRA